ncbi:molecular chaperone HtpG [Nitrobacter vulgaris]|uniref:molecular chaperone HtpG n=1 Tax=Nitrobacter vulgaris TaxID=29421 RepID=UPI00285BC06D|nr:molecular chaperone HtpG [Nitrobacter vulgaris]MDR6304333.1 molecular chaperone HtpG [Nitrobacter vulgaris]
MTSTIDKDGAAESRVFEADVAKLLQMMVHSVYSDKDVFLRELISNAADACERLRYEAISDPTLLADETRPQICITIDAERRQLTVEDNGIGMSRDEMVDALGTIARSGTKAFIEQAQAAESGDGVALIGQFGVGFYSAFMVADQVDVISRRADAKEAWRWSSDGKGTFTVTPVDESEAPARGTRVTLHLTEDATGYTDRLKLEQMIREQSGHVPVPIALVEKPGAAPTEIADGAALWTKPRGEINASEYADFYRSVAGQFDEPALTVHFRAEGRQEFTALLFVPQNRPFDLFEPDKKQQLKLYVRRVFITDDADLLPRYLRFVRGVVDSADLPLNISREMIQESPILAAIKKSMTGRILSELEKLADKDAEAYGKIWEAFGPMFKEGIYDAADRRDTILGLSRFKTTAGSLRSLKDYVGALKENQTSIYYLAGQDAARLEASPHLEGFRARGVEVLLLSDPVDSFWVTSGPSFEGKPFKSVTQGAADLAAISRLDASPEPSQDVSAGVAEFLAFLKTTLADLVSDVRSSERLTDSPVCLVASESGYDRQLEKILVGVGQLAGVSKPVLEVNPRHPLIASLAALGESDSEFKEDTARMLLDDARVLDGDRPSDALEFSKRLARIVERGLRRSTAEGSD